MRGGRAVRARPLARRLTHLGKTPSSLVGKFGLAQLLDDGCVYSGDTALASPLFSIAVENHSRYDGSFVLVKRTVASATAADLRAFVKSYHGPPPGPVGPPPGKLVSFTDVPRGGASELPANEGPGTYAVICLQSESWDVLHGIYAATLLHVPE